MSAWMGKGVCVKALRKPQKRNDGTKVSGVPSCVYVCKRAAMANMFTPFHFNTFTPIQNIY